MKTIEIIDSNIGDYEETAEMASYEETAETASYEISNSPLGLGVIMAMAGLVGIWGVTCIVNGLATAGSVQEIGHGLITAVIGI